MRSYVSIRRFMLGRIRERAQLWLLVMLAAGCSAVVDPDKAKLGPSPVPCEPGQSASCPCRDGSTSTQKCNAMARFDPCACGPAGGAGGAGGRGSAGSRSR